jgi:chorismate synthase
VGIIIDGVPAGVPLDESDFKEDLSRRRGGYKGTTGRAEPDSPEILSGIFEGRTTGAPLNIVVKNIDTDPKEYESSRYVPRPGHADYTAYKKYGGFNDFSGGGHFSGRLTVAIVITGIVAKKILSGFEFFSSVIEAGGEKDIESAIEKVATSDDSIGGVAECRVKNLPPGLGEPFFDSVESLISHLVFSIPGIKGIEFGSGFKASRLKGSENNDPFTDSSGKRSSNNQGGVEGGITNGMELVFRVAVKPTASIKKEQKSFNLKSGENVSVSIGGRHDKCIALRVPVILEAAAAIVLTDLMMLENRIERVCSSE